MDPPRDLTAINIQTDSATLTWRPPQAAVTGYILTFSSVDGVIRVRPTPTSVKSRTAKTVLLVQTKKHKLCELIVTAAFCEA